MLPDHLATPRAIKDSAGAVVWRWTSDAFGNGAANESPTGGAQFVFNQRFPGQQFDAEAGLYYNNARYYDPHVGRYITSDPIGLTGGWNTYAYVNGRPISSVDPSGLTDLIYFDPDEKASPGKLSFYASAAAIPAIPGYFTIGGHGTSQRIQDQSGHRNDRFVGPKQVYADMLKVGYKQGTPILVWSCSTGYGINSFAEQLSKLANARVRAPKTWTIYFDPSLRRIPVATYSIDEARSAMAPYYDIINSKTFRPD